MEDGGTNSCCMGELYSDYLNNGGLMNLFNGFLNKCD